MRLAKAMVVVLVVAFSYVSSAWASTTQKALTYKNAADHYLLKGNSKRAVENYENSLRLNPKSSAVYFNLAIAYYSEGKISKTIEVLEKVVELAPDDAEALYNLASLKLAQRDIPEALTHFNQAKACCDPHSEIAPLIRQGLEFLEELQSVDPGTQDLIFLLAQQGLSPITLPAAS